MKVLKFTLMFFVALSANLANAKIVRLADISLGYGKLDVGAGYGSMSVQVDASNRIMGFSVKVNADLLGVTSKINQYIDINKLSKGESQRFFMDGGKYPVLVIKSKSGFGVNGGPLQFAILTHAGYEYVDLEIEKGAHTGQFRLYSGEKMITDIDLNLRGYSVSEMKVGWYELN